MIAITRKPTAIPMKRAAGIQSNPMPMPRPRNKHATKTSPLIPFLFFRSSVSSASLSLLFKYVLKQAQLPNKLGNYIFAPMPGLTRFSYR
jgi:hypothetical protein